MKQIFGVIFIAFGLLVNISGITFSQERIEGEVLHVNYQNEIAFTDMSSYYLRVGDIVEIYANENFVGYLEVEETSSVISKLVSVRKKVNFKTGIDFRRIAPGSKVVKMIPSDEVVKDIASVNSPPIRDSSVSDGHLKKISEGCVELSNNFAEMVKDKEILQRELNSLRKELKIVLRRLREWELENVNLSREIEELRKRVSRKRKGPDVEKIKMMQKNNAALKKKLKYMSTLLDKNIKAYEPH